jgi:hypothetical protein
MKTASLMIAPQINHAITEAPTRPWRACSSTGRTKQNETASASSHRRSETRLIRPGSELDALAARPGLRRVRLVGSELGVVPVVAILLSGLPRSH